MHKRLYNSARLLVVLRPRGPLLVKSGLETPDPTRPGMEFVRTRHAHLGETVYLPGTSLKGAIRSHAERALRGLGVRACDPLDKRDRCRAAGSRDTPPEQVFSDQCPACRTFGSLGVAGRVQILDAYPWPAGAETLRRTNLTETRWQVGISRRTGQAQGGALFDLEVVTGGEFHTEVRLRNFQLWQLGLVAAVLREMDAGYVPVGFGKFRGLGQVEVELGRLEVTTATSDTRRFLGVAALCDPRDRSAYGLHAEDALAIEALVDLSRQGAVSRSWRGVELRFEGEGRDRLLSAVMEGPLANFVKEWPQRARAGARR
jgi:CRISPR/Cas system CSM-associated protein Csm3 (group 7 of RAMP superfamily)